MGEGMKATRLLLISSAICGVIAMSGCASQKEIMIEQGYPLSYADGFDDGCHSGKKAGGSMFDQFKKDVRRFESDTQYSQGWSDGFRQCETEQEALQRQVRIGIEQQKLSEQKKHNDKIENNYLKGIDTSGLENLK
jgi:hypothetical protein